MTQVPALLRRVRPSGRAFPVAAHPRALRAGNRRGDQVRGGGRGAGRARRGACRVRHGRRQGRQHHLAAQAGGACPVRESQRTRAQRRRGEHAYPIGDRLDRRQHRRRRPGARSHRSQCDGPARPEDAAHRRWRRGARRGAGAARGGHRRTVHRQPPSRAGRRAGRRARPARPRAHALLGRHGQPGRLRFHHQRHVGRSRGQPRSRCPSASPRRAPWRWT